MSVQLIIEIEDDEQADAICDALVKGEEGGELDFPFNVERFHQEAA